MVNQFAFADDCLVVAKARCEELMVLGEVVESYCVVESY